MSATDDAIVREIEEAIGHLPERDRKFINATAMMLQGLVDLDARCAMALALVGARLAAK